mmetsp:Transcript_72437/g.204782  ORF Transcript_72437/g.204782 Transcript_72437/m.204782 type:complete len:310 (+) Transcript_72437:783-1712(+)
MALLEVQVLLPEGPPPAQGGHRAHLVVRRPQRRAGGPRVQRPPEHHGRRRAAAGRGARRRCPARGRRAGRRPAGSGRRGGPRGAALRRREGPRRRAGVRVPDGRLGQLHNHGRRQHAQLALAAVPGLRRRRRGLPGHAALRPQPAELQLPLRPLRLRPGLPAPQLRPPRPEPGPGVQQQLRLAPGPGDAGHDSRELHGEGQVHAAGVGDGRRPEPPARRVRPRRPQVVQPRRLRLGGRPLLRMGDARLGQPDNDSNERHSGDSPSVTSPLVPWAHACPRPRHASSVPRATVHRSGGRWSNSGGAPRRGS